MEKEKDPMKKIKEIADKIVKEFQPEKIILFGSYAWGKPGPDSDVDLFVVKEEKRSKIEMMRKVYDVIYGSGEAVDVLVYTPKQIEKRKKLGDPFVMNILNNGRILYG